MTDTFKYLVTQYCGYEALKDTIRPYSHLYNDEHRMQREMDNLLTEMQHHKDFHQFREIRKGMTPEDIINNFQPKYAIDAAYLELYKNKYLQQKKSELEKPNIPMIQGGHEIGEAVFGVDKNGNECIKIWDGEEWVEHPLSEIPDYIDVKQYPEDLPFRIGSPAGATSFRMEAKMKMKNKMQEGAVYKLRYKSVEKSDMIETYWICVKLIHKIKNEIVNIAIMRPLTVYHKNAMRREINHISYSLSKMDCQKFHIKYKSNLEVFSSLLNWIPVPMNKAKELFFQTLYNTRAEIVVKK